MSTQKYSPTKLSWAGKISIFIALAIIGLIYSTETIPDDNSTTNTSVATTKPEQTEALVTFVIDGDTVVLENKEKVRLIGIDTPERGELGFEEARNALEELILNKTVLLVSQQSDRDVYRRLLRDIYIDDIFVNLYLVEKGFAVSLPIKPDTKFARELYEAEKALR